MEKISKVILSNMCMVYQKDKILVVNRRKSDWPGLSFPGGHVEDNETLINSVIREMKEETNLDIINPELCGTMEWDWGNNVRYIALLYRTNEYKGEIISNEEGEIFWCDIKDLEKFPWSTDFKEILDLFLKGLNLDISNKLLN